MSGSTTTTTEPIFADWLYETLNFPHPGHSGTPKTHQIALWIELFDNLLRITVHTVCMSDHFNDALRQRWTAGIHETWNGKFVAEADTAPGTTYDVPVSAPGTETPAVLRPQTWRVPIEFNPIFYAPGTGAPSRGDRSPDIIGIIDPMQFRGDTNHWWGRDHDNGETVEHNAAHEFGHFIGNADEYGLPERDFRDVVGRAPTADERMFSGGKPNGLYSTLDSVMGLYQFQMPKRRHGERFVDWLNETYVPRQTLVERFTLRMHDEVSEIPDNISSDWVWYTVREGDWLSKIAADHGMTWEQLYNYDPVGNEPNRVLLTSGDEDIIYPGEQIRVPAGG